jgi:protein-disulfide isomerase
MSRGSWGDKTLSVAALVATLGAAIAGVHRIVQPASPPRLPEGKQATSLLEWREYGREGVRQGPSDAAVTIVVFSDFQCPHCRAADSALTALRTRFGDDLAVVYRHFILNGPASVRAAVASECGHLAGAFDAVRKLLYMSADSLQTARWAQLADRAGVADTIEFKDCMEDERTTERLSRDVLAALKLG